MYRCVFSLCFFFFFNLTSLIIESSISFQYFCCKLRSLHNFNYYNISSVSCDSTTQSASADDKDTHICLFNIQEMQLFIKKIIYPEVDILSAVSWPQSAFDYVTMLRYSFEGMRSWRSRMDLSIPILYLTVILIFLA